MASKPLFPQKSVRSVAAYLKVLGKLGQGRTLWFRGHTDVRWKLVPSLVRTRKHWISDEARLITRFRQNALPLVPAGTRTQSDWDWLLQMQHYGAKTRLLDWTESPLAGLYFAV